MCGEGDNFFNKYERDCYTDIVFGYYDILWFIIYF